MNRLGSLILTALHHYGAVVIVALVAGLGVPTLFAWLAHYVSYLLGLIFFLAALKLSFREVRQELRDVRLLAEVVVIMLVVLPAVVFGVAKLIVPDLALPLLLLAAMPTAMAAPLIVEVCGGRVSLAVVFTAATSLFAPFTIPFVLTIFTGASVSVEAWPIFKTLLVVIAVPFALAELVKFALPRLTLALTKVGSSLSTLSLGLLVAGIAAAQAVPIWAAFSSRSGLGLIAILFVFFIVLQMLGYYVAPWRTGQDRITVSICLTYMNFALALYLAQTFFPTPSVVVPIALSALPWLIVPVVFQVVRQRLGLGLSN